LPLRKKKKKTTTTTLTRMKEKEREIITNKKTKEITRLSLVLCWADYFSFPSVAFHFAPVVFLFLFSGSWWLASRLYNLAVSVVYSTYILLYRFIFHHTGCLADSVGSSHPVSTYKGRRRRRRRRS
jgi:hypothetical protein